MVGTFYFIWIITASAFFNISESFRISGKTLYLIYEDRRRSNYLIKKINSDV